MWLRSSQTLHRCLSTSPSQGPARVCIVGAGPSGFYVADNLLKAHPTLTVDIIDKRQVPSGLVRSGVAPDHPEVKIVTNKFNSLLRDPRCRFLGGVSVGESVPVESLRSAYNAVVFATGIERGRKLNIPGSDLKQVYLADDFVRWYNGDTIRRRDVEFDLSSKSAVVIGQGNVAVDVCRMLLCPDEHLAGTDASPTALEAIAKSNIRTVHMVGRRGLRQAACTTKEVREVVSLPGVRLAVAEEPDSPALTFGDLDRKQKRLSKLVLSSMNIETDAEKVWSLRFCRSPARVLDDGNGSVSGVEFEITQLTRTDSGAVAAEATGKFETISCGAVFVSVGYEGNQVSGLPFDGKGNCVPNSQGRVLDSPGGSVVPGLYTSGWAKTGPVGVIVSTTADAVETAGVLLSDLSAGKLPEPTSVLDLGGSVPVTEDEWFQLESMEAERGSALGKVAHKFEEPEEIDCVLEKLRTEC